ncbi:hypothetical protein [Haloarchaeobius sp. HRN-SO-5]|uniref:hypothetical protein n=1 Tax=Haloarchaeobius sp. HRN-SO-5 TaxID=3446118 RepID=UPI003EBFE969
MTDLADTARGAVDPTAVGRLFAALAGLLGLVFVASPVYLLDGLAAETDLSTVVAFIQALAVAYGLCLVGIGWLGFEGQRPLATIAPVLLGLALLVVGPVLGFPFGLFNWAGLVLASVFAGGIPAMWMLYEAR